MLFSLFVAFYILKKEIILVVVVSWLILHFHFDFHIVEMSPIACIFLFIKFHLHVWFDILCRHVEGGMGSVSLAISKAAKEAGVHIITNAEVCLLEM